MARGGKIEVPALVLEASPYGSVDAHIIPNCPGAYFPGVPVPVTELGMLPDVSMAELEAIVEMSGGRLAITTAKAEAPNMEPDPTSPNNPDNELPKPDEEPEPEPAPEEAA